MTKSSSPLPYKNHFKIAVPTKPPKDQPKALSLSFPIQPQRDLVSPCYQPSQTDLIDNTVPIFSCSHYWPIVWQHGSGVTNYRGRREGKRQYGKGTRGFYHHGRGGSRRMGYKIDAYVLSCLWWRVFVWLLRSLVCDFQSWRRSNVGRPGQIVWVLKSPGVLFIPSQTYDPTISFFRWRPIIRTARDRDRDTSRTTIHGATVDYVRINVAGKK